MQWGACAEWAPQWHSVRARCLHVPVLPATLLGQKPTSRLLFSCHLCQVPLLHLSSRWWGLSDRPCESFAGLREAHGVSLLQMASPASLLERELQVGHQAVNSLSVAPRSDYSCLCEAQVRIVLSSPLGLMRSWGRSMGLFSGICQQHQPQQPHKCFILDVSRDFYPLLFAGCVLPLEDGSRGIVSAVVAQQSISASCAPSPSSSSKHWTGMPSFLVVLFCTCEPRYSMCN